VKRWSQGKNINQKIILLIWQLPMGIELLTEEQYRELRFFSVGHCQLVGSGYHQPSCPISRFGENARPINH
jgi:hypothetical protein